MSLDQRFAVRVVEHSLTVHENVNGFPVLSVDHSALHGLSRFHLRLEVIFKAHAVN